MSPQSGALHIDARSLESFLVDLAEGATQGMRRGQEGITEVIQEITSNQEKWGAKAGVAADEVAFIVTATAQIKQIRAYRPAAGHKAAKTRKKNAAGAPSDGGGTDKPA